jgi:hypothetical protein
VAVAVAVEDEDEDEDEEALGCDDDEGDACGDVDVEDVEPDAFPAFTDLSVLLLFILLLSAILSSRSS